MNYIKLDKSFSNKLGEQIHLLEINTDNKVERQIIININKGQQLINKFVYGNASGEFLWENYTFTESEVSKYQISKNEFDQYWNK